MPSRQYDWTTEQGGYIPFRHQSRQRREWRREDGRARVQGRLERNAERERRYEPVDEARAEARRRWDDFNASRGR